MTTGRINQGAFFDGRAVLSLYVARHHHNNTTSTTLTMPTHTLSLSTEQY